MNMVPFHLSRLNSYEYGTIPPVKGQLIYKYGTIPPVKAQLIYKYDTISPVKLPGCLAQLVAPLNQEPEALVQYQGGPHTFVSPSAYSRRVVFSYWQEYVHEVLVKLLEGLSLPRKSVVRLTDCPGMTIAV